MPYHNRDPKRDHNFDNHLFGPLGLHRGYARKFSSMVWSVASRLQEWHWVEVLDCGVEGLGFRVGSRAFANEV